jgi:hypothetical protein
LSGEERGIALELYKARHPELAEFARSPASALLKITVSDLYPVNGFK